MPTLCPPNALVDQHITMEAMGGRGKAMGEGMAKGTEAMTDMWQDAGPVVLFA